MFFPAENKRSSDKPKKPESTRVIVVGFALMILTGGVVLALPACGAGGVSVGLFDALFTAASAVCVTGLSVINVSARLSRAGHWVLLLLIQLGGLGFMVFGMGLLRMFGRRISLRSRVLMQEVMNTPGLGSILKLSRWVLGASLCVEGAGTALLAIRFVPRFGWGDGLFFSLFHSVSAFCNAGFDLFGSSLTGFASDPLVMLTVSFLIIAGGLGFVVLLDMADKTPASAHTLMVLRVTGTLLCAGWIFTLIFEWNGALSDLSWYDKIMGAFFQSVTLRTAGFSAIDQARLAPVSKLLCCMLMFIGAAPASTGGGIKVTTFSVTWHFVVTAAEGGEEPTVGRRRKERLERDLLLRATGVLLIGLAAAITVCVILMAAEPHLPPLDLLYEGFSAFGTAGLSCGLTPSLGVVSRVVLMAAMFLGRIGPLTLTLAIAGRQKKRNPSCTYPPAQIMIG